MNKHLVWFRQDLRVADNIALKRACEDQSASVYGIYIATPEQWRAHDMAPIREQFIRAHVASLNESLKQLGIPLIYMEVDTFDDIAAVMAAFVDEHQFTHVFSNREYGWNEKKRDEEVATRLIDVACQFELFHDQGILPPGLLTQTGKPYTVFTPFKKKWLQQIRQQRQGLQLPIESRSWPDTIDSVSPPAITVGGNLADWPIGESAAHERLGKFCEQRIYDYQKARDFPSEDGTSKLSAWLAAGVISSRQCLEMALSANSGRLSSGNEGIDCWISELVWRDFYIHILDSFPQISKNQPFRTNTENIQWRNDPDEFQAWCEGRTGYPIVDAAMRQLVSTGWMHNRLRMVVAMFLSKHLLIDWRWGERFFMQHLIDGHLAANNGGWQWAASTGTDAVPYFRIFNPISQSKRFDAKGDFIRRFVPELSAVDAKAIHLPADSLRQEHAPDYPAPIINLSERRELALTAFGRL